jgi:RimJ/RimL family protein N-acetyltransferase
MGTDGAGRGAARPGDATGLPLRDATDVRLRDVIEADLMVFYEHQRDPEAVAMAAFPARDWDAFEAHWRKILADEEVAARTVLAGGVVAGNVASFVQCGQREVGYWIGRAFWGRGVATRALASFLRIDERRPLTAHVARHNVASRRVLEKCGFTVRGEAVASAAAEDCGAAGSREEPVSAAPVRELILRLD